MLDEREAWTERRDTFSTLYVAPSEPAGEYQCREFDVAVMIVSAGAPVSRAFDLIVVPVHVQREHKRWLEDTLLTRLKPGGRLIIVNDP